MDKTKTTLPDAKLKADMTDYVAHKDQDWTLCEQR